MHRFALKMWLVSLLLCACAGQTKKPTPPALALPPREPLAWLPEDASFAGQIVLAPFRGTPLWAIWEKAQSAPEAEAALIDGDKIERAVFAGSDAGDDRASFVAAVSGPFLASSVAARATAQSLPPEPHGPLTFYRSGQLAFAQVYPELILVCSLDRLEALAARATQGDQIKVQQTALFRSLGERLNWSDADLVVIAEDTRGELKARAEQKARRYGFSFSAQDVVRAGAALKLGARPSLLAKVETTGEAQALALKASVEASLRGLEDNLFVGLLGLRPLVASLGATEDANYVSIGGSLAADDLNRALDRLGGMLGVALSQSTARPVAP